MSNCDECYDDETYSVQEVLADQDEAIDAVERKASDIRRDVTGELSDLALIHDGDRDGFGEDLDTILGQYGFAAVDLTDPENYEDEEEYDDEFEYYYVDDEEGED